MFDRAYFVPYNDKIEPPTPIYGHDCEKCTFVGQVHTRLDDPKICDVYICKDSIIARSGDAGPDYMSGSLRDYMSILLQASSHMSDIRWLVIQLHDKGILNFAYTFVLPEVPIVKTLCPHCSNENPISVVIEETYEGYYNAETQETTIDYDMGCQRQVTTCCSNCHRDMDSNSITNPK